MMVDCKRTEPFTAIFAVIPSVGALTAFNIFGAIFHQSDPARKIGLF